MVFLRIDSEYTSRYLIVTRRVTIVLELRVADPTSDLRLAFGVFTRDEYWGIVTARTGEVYVVVRDWVWCLVWSIESIRQTKGYREKGCTWMGR
jgi:hypothetical protein